MSIGFELFSKSGFFERGGRLYTVKYVNSKGEKKEVFVKTNMFKGVWSEESF